MTSWDGELAKFTHEQCIPLAITGVEYLCELIGENRKGIYALDDVEEVFKRLLVSHPEEFVTRKSRDFLDILDLIINLYKVGNFPRRKDELIKKIREAVGLYFPSGNKEVKRLGDVLINLAEAFYGQPDLQES